MHIRAVYQCIIPIGVTTTRNNGLQRHGMLCYDAGGNETNFRQVYKQEQNKNWRWAPWGFPGQVREPARWYLVPDGIIFQKP